MALWSRIKNLLSPRDDAARIKELAAEIARYADRYENAGQSQGAALARDYADRIATARSLQEAKALYSDFMASMGKYQDFSHRTYYERETTRAHETDADDDDTDDS